MPRLAIAETSTMTSPAPTGRAAYRMVCSVSTRNGTALKASTGPVDKLVGIPSRDLVKPAFLLALASIAQNLGTT